MARVEAEGLGASTTYAQGSATAATATATMTAPSAGQRNYVTNCILSLDGTATAKVTVTIASGSTTMLVVVLPAAAWTRNPLILPFVRPLKGEPATTVTATATTAGAGILCRVNLIGFVASE